MKIITLDFETYYDKQDFSLSKLATEAYVRDPRFEVIGIAVKVDDKPTKWFTGTHEATKKWLEKFEMSQHLVLSHNAHFDMAILNWVFGITPKGYLDTLSMANALHGINRSCSLKALAEMYGLPPKGTEVDDASGKRRLDFSKDEMNAYGLYCIHDVDLCRELFDLMVPKFPRSELKLIDITIRMFAEPKLLLDRQLLDTHLYRTRAAQAESLAALAKMLKLERDEAGLKDILMSNKKFASLLRALHIEPPMKISATTGKDTYALAKTDEAFAALLEHDDPLVQAAVAARLGNKTTIEETRTETFIGVAKRGAFPFPLKYSGAAVTHRWSGFDYNVQNLGRTSTLRRCIHAPKGYKIIAADLSNIELRLGLWLAGQDDKVKLIDDGVDLYVDLATHIFHKTYGEIVDLGKKSRERTTGKVVSLASIYGTGAAKLKDTLRIQGKVRFGDIETQRMTDLYRSSYQRVVDAWNQGKEVLDYLYETKNTPTAAAMPFLRDGLLTVTPQGIVKPSGLMLTYPDLRWMKDKKDGKMGYTYEQKRKTRDRVYGSKVYQRSVQSLARDIIGEQILAVAKRYMVVGTVHDEIIVLVEENAVNDASDYILECMRTPPAWAGGLPLDAELGVGDNYGDAK